jgi:uncharacterized protein YndB with AHSA1/START domain
MSDSEFIIKTQLQVQKPLHEVFEAVANPVHMTNYFISESTGSMEQGKTLMWKFPEFEEKFPVYIENMEPGRFITFSWDNNGKKYTVEISFLEQKNNSTLVSVSETGGRNDEEGITWLKQNTAGWANFLACLKAYLEYGINLRKGGFDFMIENKIP